MFWLYNALSSSSLILSYFKDVYRFCMTILCNTLPVFIISYYLLLIQYFNNYATKIREMLLVLGIIQQFPHLDRNQSLLIEDQHLWYLRRQGLRTRVRFVHTGLCSTHSMQTGQPKEVVFWGYLQMNWANTNNKRIMKFKSFFFFKNFMIWYECTDIVDDLSNARN